MRFPGLLLATCLFLPSCKGVRYGLSSILRSEPDYEKLEQARIRSEEPAPTFPGECRTYRGPEGNGVYALLENARPLSQADPEQGLPRLWSVPVGPSYSQVVVADGLVLVTEQRRDSEALVALSADDGSLVWESTWPGRFYEVMRKAGPGGTPLVHGDRVSVLGAQGELRSLDLATGQLRWRTNVREEEGGKDLVYGLCASPVLVGGRLIVLGASSVRAYDPDTGTPLWTAVEEKQAYATPIAARILGEDLLLVPTATRVVGLDPTSGAARWSLAWEVSMGLTCTQPMVLDENRILLSAGYGKGSQLFSLAKDSGGTVTATSEWRTPRFKSRFNEPILIGTHAFGFDEGIFACLNAETGKLAWKGGRFGYGQVLQVGTELMVIDESGDLRILAPDTAELRELVKLPGLDSDFTLNMPALAGDRLFLRNGEQLLCMGLPCIAEEMTSP